QFRSLAAAGGKLASWRATPSARRKAFTGRDFGATESFATQNRFWQVTRDSSSGVSLGASPGSPSARNSRDVDLDRAFTIQDAGQHRNALLREGEGSSP